MNIFFVFKMCSLVLITLTKANETSKDQEDMDIEITAADSTTRKSETQELKTKKFSRNSISFWPEIEKDQDLLLLKQVLKDIERGRGKNNRYKKLTKFMYPLFVGVLVAKIILIPLILKMLTAISSSAMVMSKIALITTGFIALKWIFSDSVYDTKDRFEFIYLPSGKPYRSASGGFSLWDDQSWSDSNNQYVAVAPVSNGQQQKYIPVSLKHELPYNSYGNGGGIIANKKNTLSNSVKDLYYYAQHNYNNNNDGKPFL